MKVKNSEANETSAAPAAAQRNLFATPALTATARNREHRMRRIPPNVMELENDPVLRPNLPAPLAQHIGGDPVDGDSPPPKREAPRTSSAQSASYARSEPIR